MDWADPRIIGAALGVVLAIFGGGRAWGVLMGEIRQVKGTVDETATKVQALFGSIDRMKGQVTDVRLAHAELSGRVDTWERLAGLPPLYRRTQPVRPIAEQEQDMFREDDKG